MKITIVPMKENHLPALAELERVCFAVPWSENALREELDRGIFLVAEQNGTALGYVGCQTVLDEGYITNVAVLPAYRRKGLARMLIARLQELAEENGLSFVTLEVRASNKAAAALYRSMEFIKVGVRKNFYTHPTEDAELMTWKLQAYKQGEKNENSGY